MRRITVKSLSELRENHADPRVETAAADLAELAAWCKANPKQTGTPKWTIEGGKFVVQDETKNMEMLIMSKDSELSIEVDFVASHETVYRNTNPDPTVGRDDEYDESVEVMNVELRPDGSSDTINVPVSRVEASLLEIINYINQ